MIESYITSIGCANPETQVDQEYALEAMINTLKAEKLLARKLKAIYHHTAIEKRHTVVPHFADQGHFRYNGTAKFNTSRRMAIYENSALDLAKLAIQNCKDEKDLSDVTHLITFSCTGMYAPGLDIDIIRNTSIPNNAERYAVNFMGCYAGITVMKLADQIVRSNQNAKVLLVGVEICSIHFNENKEDDFLLANALFGDGATAFLVESEPSEGKNIGIESFKSDIIDEGIQDMAWNIRDFGFEMRLSTYVPKLLSGRIKDLTMEFLKDSEREDEIQNYAIHPGGRKILEAFEQQLDIEKNDLNASYEVLKKFGNMSSVSVIFVLEELLKSMGDEKQNQNILSMAFGPGLTVESAFLRYIHV